MRLAICGTIDTHRSTPFAGVGEAAGGPDEGENALLHDVGIRHRHIAPVDVTAVPVYKPEWDIADSSAHDQRSWQVP